MYFFQPFISELFFQSIIHYFKLVYRSLKSKEMMHNRSFVLQCSAIVISKETLLCEDRAYNDDFHSSHKTQSKVCQSAAEFFWSDVTSGPVESSTLWFVDSNNIIYLECFLIPQTIDVIKILTSEIRMTPYYAILVCNNLKTRQ